MKKSGRNGARAVIIVPEGIHAFDSVTIACRAVEWCSSFWISSESRSQSEIFWWPARIFCWNTWFPVRRKRHKVSDLLGMKPTGATVGAKRKLAGYFTTVSSSFSRNLLSSEMQVQKILKIRMGWFCERRMHSASSKRGGDPKSARKNAESKGKSNGSNSKIFLKNRKNASSSKILQIAS